MTVPTLILIGESDDWTPAEACRKLVDGQDDLGMTRQKGGQSADPAHGLPERVSWFDFPSLRKPINYFGQQAVGKTADPQTEAAIRLVAWAAHGALQPDRDDFAMLRLVLLALLPQIGGILLMVGRSAK